MDLYIFHYHLQPGGVTGVIARMTDGISRFSRSIDRTCVVTGSIPDTTDLPASVGVEAMPSIGYITRERLAHYARGESDAPSSGPVGHVSTEEVAAGAAVLSRRIEEELLRRFGGPDRVWWIHNYHLGKNPAFTRALLSIAAEHPEQPMVLHIHDFPESGRYTNLRFLHQAGIGNLYPRGANITYVTINSRDREMLREGGVAPVTYLPNPVTHHPVPEGAERVRTRRRLHENYSVEFPRFTGDDRIFLYPVRSIRRKNVFEASLLTLLQDEPTSLIVTLPGVSHQEKKYSSMVENAFRDGTIPGLFGIGTTIDGSGITFPALQHASDALISSSVQEGFGYQYVTALQLGLPLIARSLDITADVVPLFDDYPSAWYSKVTVPTRTPSLSDPYSLLRFRYEERIDRLTPHLPEEAIDQLYKELDTVLTREIVEFSYLFPHMQYVILQDLRRDTDFAQEVRRLNDGLLRNVSSALNRPVHPRKEAIDASFGVRHVTAELDRIVGGAPHTDSTPVADEEKDRNSYVVRNFARLAYQRLLYE